MRECRSGQTNEHHGLLRIGEAAVPRGSTPPRVLEAIDRGDLEVERLPGRGIRLRAADVERGPHDGEVAAV